MHYPMIHVGKGPRISIHNLGGVLNALAESDRRHAYRISKHDDPAMLLQCRAGDAKLAVLTQRIELKVVKSGGGRGGSFENDRGARVTQSKACEPQIA